MNPPDLSPLLDRALDLVLAADQRIDLAIARLLDEVDGERLQGIPHRRRALFVRRLGLRRHILVADGGLGDAVGDVVHDVEARDALLFQ